MNYPDIYSYECKKCGAIIDCLSITQKEKYCNGCYSEILLEEDEPNY